MFTAEELFSIVRLGVFLIVSGFGGLGIGIALQVTRPVKPLALGIADGPFNRRLREYKDAA